ncbi:MAG: 30S ribosomal protein S6 [Clostridia bacterium]|nr:30S ribosomal protein S6 [Clostridia bacterium]
MDKVLNSYEVMFITDVSKGDEATEATVSKFVSIIENNAEVIDVAKWGKRRLAYLINDMPEGFYTVVTFKAESAFPNELERLMNIDETVMRSLVTKLEYDAAEKKAKLAEVSEPATEDAAAEASSETVAEEAVSDVEE